MLRSPALRIVVATLLLLLGCKQPARSHISSASASASHAPAVESALASATAVATASASSSASAVADAPDPKTVRPFLWRVEKGGKVSWLFGTMHLGADAEKQLNPVVWQRFEAATA